MFIKKLGGKIFGTKFTAAEQKAIDMEVKRQLAEYDRKHAIEIEALNAWIMRELFGFGEKKLKRYHDEFYSEMKALIDRYEMPDKDAPWLCTRKLKEKGIDLEKWVKEDDLDWLKR